MRTSCGVRNVPFECLSPRKQHGIDYGLCYLLPKKLAGIMIGTEMLSRIDAAQPGFFRSRGERSEVTSSARQRFRGNVKCESIAEVCSQNLRSCKADSAVSSRVGWVR